MKSEAKIVAIPMMKFCLIALGVLILGLNVVYIYSVATDLGTVKNIYMQYVPMAFAAIGCILIFLAEKPEAYFEVVRWKKKE